MVSGSGSSQTAMGGFAQSQKFIGVFDGDF